MKSIPDASSFERMWRELEARAEAQSDSELFHTTVWLECNGEFVEVEPVDATFDCPRCGRRHEPLRFR
jgi:hypothetical protein